VSKHVLKMSAFRMLDDLFRQLRRNKDIHPRTTSPGMTKTWPMRAGPLLLTMVEWSNPPLARPPTTP
jgi:hypothetical protein